MNKATLDDLPSSDDTKFWSEADVHTNIKPDDFYDQRHFLVRVPNHQAQCTHCNWGFQLDPGDKIVNGHLYNKDKQLVI